MRFLFSASTFMLMYFLSACSGYQFLSVDSALHRDTKSAFIWENDSVRIVYRFSGANGPIQFTINNKLKETIIVNWQHSAVVINGQSYSLFRNIQKVNLRERGNEYEIIDGITIDRSKTNGTIQQENPTAIIVGGTFLQDTKGILSENKLHIPAQVTPIRSALNNTLPVKKYLFSEDNSPLKFDLYLNLQFEGYTKPVVIRNSFYINELLKGNMSLQQFLPGDNRFYTY
ncbi:MAG: hypothetical protein MUF68_03010 [Cyclobacteriaceae bacterium]|jgi:hypothetical protein|nr:hypothetical protein [Cyclobacteriaceae bacterium]